MENEEVNTHSVVINPANPGVQLIVSAIADIMPGVEDFEDDQMAQFLTDLIVAENGAPSIARYCGVDFAHFFSSGNYGSATSGIHHAYTIINNRHNSSVCGHSHKRDLYFKDGAGSIGMVVGCLKGGKESWAGQANNEWWHGLVVMRDIEGGVFEPEFVSLKQIREMYG